MKKIIRYSLFALLGVLILISVAVIVMLPQLKFWMNQKIEKPFPNVTLFIGGGGNSGIIETDSAILVIDTKMSKFAEKQFNLVEELKKDKPVIVINTHFHGDHVKGNYLYKDARIYAGGVPEDITRWKQSDGSKCDPTDWVSDSLVLNLGNETVILLNIGRGHTFNDLVVYLPSHKILFGGDVILNKVNPVLKKESGAIVNGYLRQYKLIKSRYSPQLVVPGHGQMGSSAMIDENIQYFTDMLEAASSSEPKKIFRKYKSWVIMPSMASPEITVEYIQANKEE